MSEVGERPKEIPVKKAPQEPVPKETAAEKPNHTPLDVDKLRIDDVRNRLTELSKGEKQITDKAKEVGLSDEQMMVLKHELRDTFDPEFSTFGHGTAIEAADKILEEGLRVYGRMQPRLDQSAVPLYDSSKSFDEQSDGALQAMFNWPHRIRGSGAVVVSMVPNAPEGTVGGRRYFDAVFEEEFCFHLEV